MIILDTDLGKAQFDNQQGNRNGEHGVAEKSHPLKLKPVVRFVRHNAPCYARVLSA